MRKYPYAPHPFVITPPLEEKREYREGETFYFELTLIGKSVDYLPYFIFTFDELGKIGIGKGRGKYNLEEVKTIALGERSKDKGERKEKQGERSRVQGEGIETIYSGKDKILRNNFKVLTIDDIGPFNLSPLSLHLSFLTPTRLKFDGRLTPSLEFHFFPIFIAGKN